MTTVSVRNSVSGERTISSGAVFLTGISTSVKPINETTRISFKATSRLNFPSMSETAPAPWRPLTTIPAPTKASPSSDFTLPFKLKRSSDLPTLSFSATRLSETSTVRPLTLTDTGCPSNTFRTAVSTSTSFSDTETFRSISIPDDLTTTEYPYRAWISAITLDTLTSRIFNDMSWAETSTHDRRVAVSKVTNILIKDFRFILLLV